jgi:protein-L-isoaspartate O-methyltransferase
MNRKLRGIYPDAPFIPYSATAALAPVLSPDMTVVEIGAGMSTPWLATRVQRVVSYEWHEGWYERVKQELDRRGLRNVDLRRCFGHEQMNFEDFDEGTWILASSMGARALNASSIFGRS